MNFQPPFSEPPSFFSYPSNIEIIFDFSDIITKIHPPFQNPGSALERAQNNCDPELANFFADCQNFANLQRSGSAACESPKFWQSRQFCLLTSKLSYFFKHIWIKLRRDNFGGLVQFDACDGGTKSFFPGPTYSFYSYFNGNEEYEPRLYSNFYDSYFGSGYNLRARHFAVCKSCDAYVNQRRFG